MNLYRRKTDKYSSHMIIANIISSQKKFKTKALDLGCDIGFLGRSLLPFRHHYELHGVDVDQKALARAKKWYHQVHQFDLNDKKWPIKEKFEIVVIADTLEHLYKPNEVIERIIKLFKKKGLVIISVPNSAYWWARLQILFGKFPKEDRGIFDKTHLHFYTLQTIKDLVNSFPEIKLEKVYPTTLPLQFIFKKYKKLFPVKTLYNLCYLLAQVWPTLFAYQFILVATKRK